MSLKRELVQRAVRRGANVAALSREFGVSRQTAHKWIRRFRESGLEGLDEQSRRPKSSPGNTSEQIVLAVLRAREAHPSWGPKKLVEVLRGSLRKEAPSRATIARILDRFGKVRRRRRRPASLSVIDRAPTRTAKAANDVWTIDFKGWWRTRDGARCEPLTIRDAFSRYVLCVKAMRSTGAAAVRVELDRLFRKHGIPKAIQCDNGQPFVSVQSRAGLTRLSAWWVSLGIEIVRSRPGAPQDNGAHERMHRDISQEVQAFPEASRRSEQRVLDRWRHEFNNERPHEALGGKTPAVLFKPTVRRAPIVQQHIYPASWLRRHVCGPNGSISIDAVQFGIGRAFIGFDVGIESLSERRHRIWFGRIDLGEIELEIRSATIERVCRDVLRKRPRRATISRSRRVG